MLASTLALYASIVASEALESCKDDPHIFQEQVAKRCRKVFHTHLSQLKFITPDPEPRPVHSPLQEKKPAHP